MSAKKFRELDADALARQAQEAREQLFRFRFQMGMGQAESLKKYRILKKDRARLLTVLSEKSKAGELPAIQAAPSKTPASKSKVSK